MKYYLTYSLFLIIALCLFSSCNSNINAEEKSSWTIEGFEKVDSLNPILKPSDELSFTDPITGNIVKWESRNVLNPASVVKDGKIHMLYRAQDSLGTSRIGLAISEDGLYFEKQPSPILYPLNDHMKIYEWNYRKKDGDSLSEECKSCYFDGVEDPRIIQDEQGNYILTYTAYDGKTARLSVASSPDLINWTKHGLAFKDEKYHDLWSKAGAIVAEQQGSKMVAKKIDGNYWMYFGDTSIFLATSTDLKNWEICENAESSVKISVLNPRKGYFDSRLVEPGPFAIYKEDGILLIYNASNAANFNDPSLPKFTYAAGQALFDKNSPFKLIDRTDSYFISPDKDYEKVGEVNNVCFVEGLSFLNDQWFLYYGTADSKIAVTVSSN